VQRYKEYMPIGEYCDIDCYRLFEGLYLFAAVIPLHISNINKGHFQFIIQGKLGGV
jgi:hypothetical protein